jgi:SAM-dependent methyltransferase
MTIPLPGLEGQFGAAEAARVARFFDAETAGYLDDLPALKDFARRTGSPLLELGCGTGRLLALLAKSGYQITGVDVSPAMLEIARRKVEAAHVAHRVTFVEGDYANAALQGPFRFIFIVMNTFMHLLTRADQLVALRHWHSLLAPGGLLLIDNFQPDVTELASLNGNVEYDKSWPDEETGGGVIKQVIRTVDQAEQRMHVTLMYDEIAADGALRRTVVPFDLRYMWRYEAELLLEKAGFSVEGVFGDWELGPLDGASERQILLARRE